MAGELAALGERPSWPDIRAAGARSRAAFRHDDRHRLLILARRTDADWTSLLAEARSRLEKGPDPLANGRWPARAHSRMESGRVFGASGPRPGALALLFPGQGSQYVGMLRELACLFPRMQSALAAMNCAAGGGAGTGLASDRIYPPAAFDDAVRQEREDALRDTRFAQPAIGAVSLGLLGILEDFGVRADLVGGHSFGELTALLRGRPDRRRRLRPAGPAPRRPDGATVPPWVRRDARRLRGRRGGRPSPSATRAWTWSSPTRTPRGSASSRARPRRSNAVGVPCPSGGSPRGPSRSRPPSTAGSSPARGSRSAARSTPIEPGPLGDPGLRQRDRRALPR